MRTDPIADFLSAVKNALMVDKESVCVISSKIIKRIAEILKEQGFISSFEEVVKENGQKQLILFLKYDQEGNGVISGLKRISRPGLRTYKSVADMPEIRGGMGIAIVSTSKGIMLSSKAKESNIGGELLCAVW